MSPETSSGGMRLLEEIKQSAGMVRVIGVILLIMGVLALAAPLATGLSIAIVVGILLLIGGIGQLVFAFRAGGLGKAPLILVIGALTSVVGAVMIANPGAALAALALVLMAYFIVYGIMEIIWAFQIRPVTGWGWTLINGLVSLLLGLLIWAQFPLSGAWAVGVLVGIKLIFSGWMLIMLGSAVQSGAKEI
jgi:uncharacterized membrane protein HdeD (DUF308 family)